MPTRSLRLDAMNIKAEGNSVSGHGYQHIGPIIYGMLPTLLQSLIRETGIEVLSLIYDFQTRTNLLVRRRRKRRLLGCSWKVCASIRWKIATTTFGSLIPKPFSGFFVIQKKEIGIGITLRNGCANNGWAKTMGCIGLRARLAQENLP